MIGPFFLYRASAYRISASASSILVSVIDVKVKIGYCEVLERGNW